MMNFYVEMQYLIDEGFVEKTGPDLYRLTATGVEFAEAMEEQDRNDELHGT